jgi:hypothetical protein
VKRTRAEEYRRLAHECLAAARSAATDELRALLTERAAFWLGLAQEQEDESANLKRPIPSSPAGEPPVVQQQQQVQTRPRRDDAGE